MAGPIVQIEGVGNVQFPEGMSQQEINAAADKLYTQAASKQIAAHPPGMPKSNVDMQPSYLAAAIENSPSHGNYLDPATPNRRIMEQMSPEDRDAADRALLTTAASSIPGMGLIQPRSAMVPAGVGFAGSQLLEKAVPSIATQGIKSVGSFIAAHPKIAATGLGLLGLNHFLPKIKMFGGD